VHEAGVGQEPDRAVARAPEEGGPEQGCDPRDLGIDHANDAVRGIEENDAHGKIVERPFEAPQIRLPGSAIGVDGGERFLSKIANPVIVLGRVRAENDDAVGGLQEQRQRGADRARPPARPAVTNTSSPESGAAEKVRSNSLAKKRQQSGSRASRGGMLSGKRGLAQFNSGWQSSELKNSSSFVLRISASVFSPIVPF
jgi:hypothetical protein